VTGWIDPIATWHGPVVVTGTDTGVGKTVATAAIAAAATAAGLWVAVVKPGQTGVATGEESDVDTVVRLSAPASAWTLASYPDPLAPLAAARVAGMAALAMDTVRSAVHQAVTTHDLVLIEGAGGLLVPMGSDGWTIAELAVALRTPTIVVARAGLGTLNHTALTLEACAHRGIDARLIIGAWPAEPELVHRTNMVDLPGELVGVIPEGVGRWPGAEFRAAAPGWVGPQFHGRFDRTSFLTDQAAGHNAHDPR
jgi:dethiobiotin synthetase